MTLVIAIPTNLINLGVEMLESGAYRIDRFAVRTFEDTLDRWDHTRSPWVYGGLDALWTAIVDPDLEERRMLKDKDKEKNTLAKKLAKKSQEREKVGIPLDRATQQSLVLTREIEDLKSTDEVRKSLSVQHRKKLHQLSNNLMNNMI